MKVIISIIALILFVLLARFVYLRVTSVTPVVQENILPIPSPSYFPVASPSPSPSPSATPTGTVRTTPRPTATTSGSLGRLPETGANELAYIIVAVGAGLAGLKLRKIRA